MYMSDSKASKIFEACVDEMYRASTPSTTWKDIKKHMLPIDRCTDRCTVYNKHFILEEDYNRIKEKYAKKLNLFYQRKPDWFLLDYAPAFKKRGDEDV